MRLLAALSGGVDSAVAAALAVEAGHDVTAVHLALSEAPATLRTGSRGCCSKEDARDASRVADVRDRATTDEGKPRPEVAGAAVGVVVVAALLVWWRRRRCGAAARGSRMRSSVGSSEVTET